MLPLLLLAVAGAPVVPHPDGRSVYVADGDSDAVWLATPGKKAAKLFDCAWPSALALDGDVLWAACRSDGALISSTGARVEAGAEPVALAVDPQHRELFVALATGRELLAVDLDTHEVTRRRALDFEPRALALTAAGLMVVPRSRCDIVTVAYGFDEAFDVRRELKPLLGGYKMLRGADTCQNAAAVEWHGGALIASTGFSTGFGSRAWSMTFIVGPTIFVTGFPESWSDPTGICARKDGFVTAARAPGKGLLLMPIHEDGDFGLHADPLAGLDDGVTGCAATKKSWVALEEHARSVAFVDVNDVSKVRRVALPRSRLDAQLRRGRDLFFATDERISDSGFSCQACHPDGREDATVWKTDGLPRQTPQLAGRLEGTGPFNWHGTAKTVEQNLRSTTARLGGDGFSSTERYELARYLREGMRRVSRPKPADAEAVARGRALFEDPAVGCATCHPADLQFTDGAAHDLGSVSEREKKERAQLVRDHAGSEPSHPIAKLRTRFDTPSLKYVGLTAPYFHDGSAKTLEEVLERPGMGDPSRLTPEQRRDLAAYLRSL